MRLRCGPASTPLFWILCGVLAGLGSPMAARLPRQNQTCWEEEKEYYEPRVGVCCTRCPPGMYVSTQCDGTRDTVCAACPERSFNAHWNHVKQCQLCRPCDAVLGFEEVAPCNRTHQNQCRCQPGTSCVFWDSKCVHCQPLPPCPPGMEADTAGEHEEGPARCLPCKAGFFQNASSPSARCQPHTSCEDRGLVEAVPGTLETDRICQSPPQPPDAPGTGTALLALALLALLVLVSSLTCACAWRSHPTLCRKLGSLLKRRPQAEEFSSGPVPKVNPPVPDLVRPLLPDPEDVPPPPLGTPRTPILETARLQQQSPVGPPREPEVEAGEPGPVATGASGIHVTGGSVTVTGNIYIYNGPVLGAARAAAPRAAEPPFPTPEEGPPGPAQEDGKAWHLAETETGAGAEAALGGPGAEAGDQARHAA
ncbi:tumor necrosis factor receptor superfamily member 3 isoform X2 [Dipodomys merriami]|uniref:tumor necrosis factor receptor superfamily member 3 isoform X2 n=1 Tax=Dipodomys merriami TaxID=94247 RepID=UPI003855FE44